MSHYQGDPPINPPDPAAIFHERCPECGEPCEFADVPCEDCQADAESEEEEKEEDLSCAS
jgi:hypothetical protein